MVTHVYVRQKLRQFCKAIIVQLKKLNFKRGNYDILEDVIE